jgi:hypothetical protein
LRVGRKPRSGGSSSVQQSFVRHNRAIVGHP